jgi:hypothetical protein
MRSTRWVHPPACFFEAVASTDDRMEPVVEDEDEGILGLGSIDSDFNCLF